MEGRPVIGCRKVIKEVKEGLYLTPGLRYRHSVCMYAGIAGNELLGLKLV